MGLSLLKRRYGPRRQTMHVIAECRAERDYSLWLRFDDGLEGYVYLGDLVGTKYFTPWSNVETFLQVSIDPFTGTVEWEGGIKVDPDALYRDLVSKVRHALH